LDLGHMEKVITFFFLACMIYLPVTLHNIAPTR
jgi:hypothetical protein